MSSLYYPGFVDRHVLGKNHSRCEDAFHCAYEKLDVGRYQTKHAENCSKGSTCQDIGTDDFWSPQISQLLRRGQTPVIIVRGGDEPPIEVSIISAQTPSESDEGFFKYRPIQFLSVAIDLFATHFRIRQAGRLQPNVTCAIPYVCFSHVWSEYVLK